MSQTPEYAKEALKRICAEFDLDIIGAGVKSNLLETLQGAENPEAAFKIKMRLDATDEIILEMKRIAGVNGF